MIQNIYPDKFHNEYRALSPEPGDKVFCYNQANELLMNNEGNLVWPTVGQVCEAIADDTASVQATTGVEALSDFVYLFSISEERYFLFMPQVAIDANIEQDLSQKNSQSIVDIAGFSYDKMFATRSRQPKREVFAAATAFHLYQWYRDNRRCGRCGQPLEHDKSQRMLHCSHCNNMVFPKVAPAVIVGIFHKNRLLLTKYANREYTRYALVAGFNEIGETPEETVAREVMEEVGLKVGPCKYYKSQPWGFDSNLLLGFFTELDDAAKITMDEEELAVACWKNREDVPEDMGGLSLTGEMMNFFKNKDEFEKWWNQ